MVGFAAMGPSSRRALTSAGAGIYNNLAAAPVRSIGKAGLLGMEVSAREMFAGIPIYGVLNEVVADEAEKFRLDTGLEE
eukprot:gene30395-3134_t